MVFKRFAIVIITCSLGVIAYIMYRNQTLEHVVARVERSIFFVSTYKNGEPYSSGSGFFLQSPDLSEEAVFGVTNVHVVKGSDSIVITTNNQKSFWITQIDYYSDSSDLLLFRWNIQDIELNNLNFLKIEESSIEKSQFVFSVSHPQGLDYSFSSGSVSSTRDFDPFGKIVQTTTPISAGSSGSPLLSRRGRVIGVNTFSFIDGQNLNFAVRLDPLVLINLEKWSDKDYRELLFGWAHSVRIGNQFWMDVNLNKKKFRNGDVIPEAKTAMEWEQANNEGKPIWAYPRLASWAFNRLEDSRAVNTPESGILYNWYAINDERGLAPVGWRIPSADDWNNLVDGLGGPRFSTAKKLKSTSGWNYLHERFAGDTNETGFSALPFGRIEYEGKTTGLGNSAYFWMKDEAARNPAQMGLAVRLGPGDIEMDTKGNWVLSPQIELAVLPKKSGCAIRCIKENP